MTFSRFNAMRNRSGSGSSPLPPQQSSNPRQFMPPSHYAAAAGVEYSPRTYATTDTSSVSSGSYVASVIYPTQQPSDFSSESDTASVSLVSRLARKSSWKSVTSNSSGTKSERSPSVSKQKRRESQVEDLALVETQLLPSLRDTIGRMTQASSPIPTNCGNYPSIQTSKPTHLENHDFSQRRIKSPSASSSAPRPILKSSLRTPNISSNTTAFSPPAKSLRSVRSMTTPNPDRAVLSPPIIRALPSTSSRTPSTSSRASSSNPTTPNLPIVKVNQPPSRIPTPRSSRSALHQQSEQILRDTRADAEQTPRGFPTPITKEKAPWSPNSTKDSSRTARSGYGLGLDLDLGVNSQHRHQIMSYAEDETGSQFDDAEGDDEVSIYEGDGWREDEERFADSHRQALDEEELIRRKRRETLLAIVDGIQLQYGNGGAARESSEYSGFEGWAIGSAESIFVHDELEKRRRSALLAGGDVPLDFNAEEPASATFSHRNPNEPTVQNRRRTKEIPSILEQNCGLDDQGVQSTDCGSDSRRFDQFGRPTRQSRSGSHNSNREHPSQKFSAPPVNPHRPDYVVKRPEIVSQMPNPQRRSVSSPINPTDSQLPVLLSSPAKTAKQKSHLQTGKGMPSLSPSFNDYSGRSALKPISRDERDSFGIPSSLSYGFRAAAAGVPRSDSDSSLLESDDRWMEEAQDPNEITGSSFLSHGAERLFQGLADEGEQGGQEYLMDIECPSQDECSDYGFGTPPCAETVFESSSSLASDSSGPSVYDDGISGQSWRQQHRQQETADHRVDSSSTRRTWRSMIQDSVYNSLADRYGTREMHRQEIIWELCESEAAFVRRLRNIIRLFVKPLRLQDTSSWIEGVPGDVTRLFDWLEDIMNLHVQINSALREMREKQYPMVERAAETIRSFISRLEVYQPYLVRVEEVVVQIADDLKRKKTDFCEFVKFQEQDEDCDGLRLEMLLLEPVHRLAKYSEIFQALWGLTPKDHVDHLATFSLVHSTEMIVRVLREVKEREEEYDLIKTISLSIEGLPSSINLARRERRLLARGPLYRVQVPDRPSLEHPVQDRRRSRRSMILLNAINDWDVQRAEQAINNGTTSLDSYYNQGSTVINEPSIYSQTSSHEHQSSASEEEASDSSCYKKRSSFLGLPPDPHSKQTLVDVFVFTDLVLIANPLHKRQGHGSASVKERWRLLDQVGTGRILNVSERRNVVQGHEEFLVELDILPIDLHGLENGVVCDDSRVTTIHLSLPKRSTQGTEDIDAGRRQNWLAALNQCFQFTLRSLSFPSHSGNYLAHGSNVDLESDTRETVIGILNSGLPLPKSPSIQIEDLSSGKVTDLAQVEREERGWWAVRFRQVFKEIQRQDVSLLVPNAFPNSVLGSSAAGLTGKPPISVKRSLKLGSVASSMDSISQSVQEWER